MEVEDTLGYLTGRWTLSRAITDHLTGVRGSFDGEARVRTVGRRARYEENGRLRFDRYDGDARRALDLVGGDGSVVAVLFTDGRRFVDLDLSRGSDRAVHQCSDDRYELEFVVTSPDLLFERWRVRGPIKDYEARTTWRRSFRSPVPRLGGIRSSDLPDTRPAR
jgi:hypothetical protein